MGKTWKTVRENRVATTLALALSLPLLLPAGGCRRAATVSSPAAAEAQPGDVREPVAESDLPAPVLAAGRSRPRATIAEAAKVTRGGQVVFYELRLTGTRKTHMVVSPDGQVLTFD
jgi:hypothetical protein